jgi:mannose/cellobiose epimerase-like protein (N-acyl-D-glucosamine 2-epimerase family)
LPRVQPRRHSLKLRETLWIYAARDDRSTKRIAHPVWHSQQNCYIGFMDIQKTVRRELQVKLDVLKHWLDDKALPLWLSTGFDQNGGFYERVGLDASPMKDDNRRARVQPRQVYCAVTGGMRGFEGDWSTAAKGGLHYFETVYRLENGFYGALANADGILIDETFDLYNQAFALFAFSQYALAFPETKVAMEARANALLDALHALYKHPVAGFEEAMPIKLPLCSNPHMHLFEACQAWEQIASKPLRWRSLADEIADLAMSKFIDARSGGLREFFDHDWSPYPGEKGRIMEPGHQLKWGWLLARWGERRGNQAALVKARQLFQIAMDHGMSPDGKVTIMSLYDDFSIHDPIARLWPQTEWLKAATLLAKLTSGTKRAAYLADAIRACQAVTMFLETPIAGLWFDKRKPDGTFIDEPSPASTFYHIVCAIYEAKDNLAAI